MFHWKLSRPNSLLPFHLLAFLSEEEILELIAFPRDAPNVATSGCEEAL